MFDSTKKKSFTSSKRKLISKMNCYNYCMPKELISGDIPRDWTSPPAHPASVYALTMQRLSFGCLLTRRQGCTRGCSLSLKHLSWLHAQIRKERPVSSGPGSHESGHTYTPNQSDGLCIPKEPIFIFFTFNPCRPLKRRCIKWDCTLPKTTDKLYALMSLLIVFHVRHRWGADRQ